VLLQKRSLPHFECSFEFAHVLQRSPGTHRNLTPQQATNPEHPVAGPGVLTYTGVLTYRPQGLGGMGGGGGGGGGGGV